MAVETVGDPFVIAFGKRWTKLCLRTKDQKYCELDR